MTRETKIGLLVGLAFIIVIGILLSDHFRGTQEPPPAMLDRTGATVRQTVNAPGMTDANQPIIVAPNQINPRGSVRTPGDIDPGPGPVVLNPNVQPGQAAGLSPTDPLVATARQHGEEIISAEGSPSNPAANAQRSYVAQSGDSVSRMASRLMGGNTAKNRAAIIAANQSLQDDPNKVVVGQTYVIPGGSVAVSAGPSKAAVSVASGSAATGGSAYVYTVKEGDTLWGIATGQLGDAGAIDAIKALNHTALHGGSTLRPGMKLRLPSAPVAIAE